MEILKGFINTAILIILSLHFLGAQTLERKSYLGIQMKSSEEKNGIEVIHVYENSTASNLNLQVHDIILTINGVPYENVNDLVKVVPSWTVGEQLTMDIIRDEEKIELSGKIIAKPLETSDYAQVIYGEVDFDGGKLRSILELPFGVENPPVILFIPGNGCGSLDYWYSSQTPVKLLVESFVEKGIAVFRVEKPGIGDSYGDVHCIEMDFDYQLAAFQAGLEKLKNTPEIDVNRIYLFGESLGVVSAPFMANESNVSGIIAWGGISTS